MFPLLETIRFEKGVFSNTGYHLRRMQQSAEAYLGKSLQFDFYKLLEKAGQTANNKDKLFKFRLLYSAEAYRWEFLKYSLPRLKTLKIIEDNTIDYRYKYSDRSRLNRLRQLRADADDILIVKNGAVTDTSFANIIFYDGTKWITPKSPLLRGTQRAYLIERGRLTEETILFSDIFTFRQARIINAMIRFEDAVTVYIVS